METEIISIQYERKSKTRLKEESVRKAEVDENFQNRFIRLMAEGLRNSSDLKSLNVENT